MRLSPMNSLIGAPLRWRGSTDRCWKQTQWVHVGRTRFFRTLHHAALPPARCWAAALGIPMRIAPWPPLATPRPKPSTATPSLDAIDRLHFNPYPYASSSSRFGHEPNRGIAC